MRFVITLGCVDQQPSFWKRQKQNSPILRYWWLLPVILLAVFVYTGSISIWLALAGVAITLLAVIAHRLALLAKK
jgi:membrane protein YdbS with pleckstrin-like domain